MAATYLGGGWRWMARVGRLVPRKLRDAVYDLVARNRHRLARRSERCLLPTPEQRRRFLDGPDAEPGTDAPTPPAPR
jgi:predicted DCC family thiol-disulfide oxidoreductase YuxK